MIIKCRRIFLKKAEQQTVNRSNEILNAEGRVASERILKVRWVQGR